MCLYSEIQRFWKPKQNTPIFVKPGPGGPFQNIEPEFSKISNTTWPKARVGLKLGPIPNFFVKKFDTAKACNYDIVGELLVWKNVEEIDFVYISSKK